MTAANSLSLHDLEGICDYCGEGCDSTQDELNAINCTFETCPSPMVYHQHCVETYLKSIRLDKQRKTGFQCPRGSGKSSKCDKPCPGRVTKSHPIRARNDNSKKRRKAKMPEMAPPPVPVPVNKLPGVLKQEAKKEPKKCTPASVSGGGKKSSSNHKAILAQEAAAVAAAAARREILAARGGGARKEPLKAAAAAAAVAAAPPPRVGRHKAAVAAEESDDSDDATPVPRATASLADFGYTVTPAVKKATPATAACSNPWTSARARSNSSPHMPTAQVAQEPSAAAAAAALLPGAIPSASCSPTRLFDTSSRAQVTEEASSSGRCAKEGGPPCPAPPPQPWSLACVAALRSRKALVFSRQLQELGFEREQARQAVQRHGSNLQHCLDWLLHARHLPHSAVDVSAELAYLDALVATKTTSQEMLEASVVSSADTGNGEPSPRKTSFPRNTTTTTTAATTTTSSSSSPGLLDNDQQQQRQPQQQQCGTWSEVALIGGGLSSSSGASAHDDAALSDCYYLYYSPSMLRSPSSSTHSGASSSIWSVPGVSLLAKADFQGPPISTHGSCKPWAADGEDEEDLFVASLLSKLLI